MIQENQRLRHRRLSEEERTLWHGVTRSVAPLKQRKRQKAVPQADETGKAPREPGSASLARSSPSQRRTAAKEPALAPMERRFRQRLARGTMPIDARLDLHGRSQREAHGALLRFLHQSQREGARTVLIITGKGGADSDPSSRRGVLRRQVPLWLALPEFRSLVVGYDQAAIAHGGEGALYVRIRRRR